MQTGSSHPILPAFNISSVCTLTTASAAKRRLALDKQLKLFNLTTHYVEGPMYNNANGCLNGWLKMLQTCRTYPALMTEDDVDLQLRYDILRVPLIPQETLLSIGSGNCMSSDCSKPLWVKPHMKRPYTFGTVAMFIPSQAVAERLIRWVSHDVSAGGSPYNGSHIDGKIYLGAFGAKILCPPLLGWRPAMSIVTRHTKKTNKSLQCYARH